MKDELPHISLPVFVLAVMILLPIYVVRRAIGWRVEEVCAPKLVSVRVGTRKIYADPEWAAQLRDGHTQGQRAFVRSFGSRRMIWRLWVRVFCKFVDYWRGVRGDGVLPDAKVWVQDFGTDPPLFLAGCRPPTQPAYFWRVAARQPNPRIYWRVAARQPNPRIYWRVANSSNF